MRKHRPARENQQRDMITKASEVSIEKEPVVESELLNHLSPERRLKKIVVAIPAYNEEVAIGSVVLKARKYADQVVVIDDGSTDATAEVAEAAGATVIRHGENKGYGAALRSCFEVASKLNADVLVILDGDGQHDPNDIPVVATPVLDGEADIAIGSRFLSPASQEVPSYRKFGIKAITFLSNLFSREKISDAQSGFRAYSRRAIEVLRDLESSGMKASTEILLEGGLHNLKVVEVPIHVNYNVSGSTLNPLSHGLGVFGGLIEIVSQRRPLFFFGTAGLILTGLGVILGIAALWHLAVTKYISVGILGMSLLSTLLVLLGVFSLFTGIVLNAQRGRKG